MSKFDIPAYLDIITSPVLFTAWQEFVRGKKTKLDVAEFALNLYSNLSLLRDELESGQYIHGGYEYFKVKDPKERDIHKASVRDRVVHHLLYCALYSHFDHYFIFDSYSCRNNKGSHKALRRFKEFTYSASQRNTQPVWILKCDIRKCFASVDHRILLILLRKHITCLQLFKVIETVVDSFSSSQPGKGIPLGNLTSQLFINVYLHELDIYIKRTLGVKYYIRYADDFILMANSPRQLELWRDQIGSFLETKLNMTLHPYKIFIQTLTSGLPFLGWKHFTDHMIPRKSSVRRMWQVISISKNQQATIQSYLGMLSHGTAYKLKQKIFNHFEITSDG